MARFRFFQGAAVSAATADEMTRPDLLRILLGFTICTTAKRFDGTMAIA
jgi:hypothetical protein